MWRPHATQWMCWCWWSCSEGPSAALRSRLVIRGCFFMAPPHVSRPGSCQPPRRRVRSEPYCPERQRVRGTNETGRNQRGGACRPDDQTPEKHGTVKPFRALGRGGGASLGGV